MLKCSPHVLGHLNSKQFFKFENEVKVGLSGGSNVYSIVLKRDIMKRKDQLH